jgi:hypothetical protein
MCIICYVIIFLFYLLEIETIINILLKTSILQINIHICLFSFTILLLAICVSMIIE